MNHLFESKPLTRISHHFSGNSHTQSTDLPFQPDEAVLLEHCPHLAERQSRSTEPRFSPRTCEKYGLIGIILAGGCGTRLWPFSRSDCPKQFLKFEGNYSFFQNTVIRNLEFIPLEKLYVVTSENYRCEVTRQLREIDSLLEKNVIFEPAQRNTAPALALALKTICAPSPEATLFLSPADHLIAPLEPFIQSLQEARKLAEKGHIVAFGIRPTRPETGYGYLKVQGNRVFEFIEKPNQSKAQAFLQDGHYFWNSGMFLFSNKTILEEMARHCPEMLEESLCYTSLPNLSIDYALMEKTKKLAMVPLSVSWSDIGSWENIYETLEKDEEENVIRGDVVAIGTSGSLIFSEKRLVAAVGLKDIFLVETEDVVLAASRKDAQKVKEVVEQLKSKGKKQVQEHQTVYRPWGSYTILEEGKRYKIKRIHVDAGQKLSLQMHYHRSEHWVVVTGTAQVTIDGQEKLVHEGESIFVPKSAAHRVENPGKVPLEIIEVQVGEYLGEDDIVRFEDDYGRSVEQKRFESVSVIVQNSG